MRCGHLPFLHHTVQSFMVLPHMVQYMSVKACTDGGNDDEPHGCQHCRTVVMKLAPGESYECEECGTEWEYRADEDRGPWPVDARDE